MNAYVFEEIAVGLTEGFEVTVTEEMFDRFLDITGDVNPLHNDAAFAQKKGHPARVAFGMLTASFLSTLAGVYLPGKNSLIHEVEVKFAKPVPQNFRNYMTKLFRANPYKHRTLSPTREGKKCFAAR